MVWNTGYCKIQMDEVTHNLMLFTKCREEECLCGVTLDGWFDFSSPFQYGVNVFPWEIFVQQWGSHSLGIHQDAQFEPHMLCLQTLSFCCHVSSRTQNLNFPLSPSCSCSFITSVNSFYFFLSLNLPARTITLSLDKQHSVKPDSKILQRLRLACKTECCAQTEEKKKWTTRKSHYLRQMLHQSFFLAFM